MPRPSTSVLSILLIASLLVGGCGDDDPVTPTDPTEPTSFTQEFDGSVNRNGADTHPFTIQRAGTVTARLTEILPDSALVIGLSLGTWNGATCQIILANDNATQGSTVVGTASTSGEFCARVYDVGNISEDVSYRLQVTHF